MYMAVPDREENGPSFYNHTKAAVVEKETPTHSSHLALAASEKCERLSRKLIKFGYAEDIDTMNAICDLAEETYTYLSIWHRKTQYIIEQMEKNGEKLDNRLRRTLSSNQLALAGNLETIFRVLPHLAGNEDIIVNDFYSIMDGNMSIQAAIKETENTLNESILS
jgi:hypothetical protein